MHTPMRLTTTLGPGLFAGLLYGCGAAPVGIGAGTFLDGAWILRSDNFAEVCFEISSNQVVAYSDFNCTRQLTPSTNAVANLSGSIIHVELHDEFGSFGSANTFEGTLQFDGTFRGTIFRRTTGLVVPDVVMARH